MKAEQLKKVPFPACTEECETITHFGVGECENVCPFKFLNKE